MSNITITDNNKTAIFGAIVTITGKYTAAEAMNAAEAFMTLHRSETKQALSFDTMTLSHEKCINCIRENRNHTGYADPNHKHEWFAYYGTAQPTN